MDEIQNLVQTTFVLGSVPKSVETNESLTSEESLGTVSSSGSLLHESRFQIGAELGVSRDLTCGVTFQKRGKFFSRSGRVREESTSNGHATTPHPLEVPFHEG